MKKKKNDHYSPRPLPANENSSNKVLPALQQQRSAQINLNTAHDPAGDALPPWRDKLEDADVMKMQGCEVIADDAAKLVIIRPKNGAKEGIITRLDPGKSVSNDDITSGNATQADKDYYDFFQLEMLRLKLSKSLLRNIRDILYNLREEYIFTKH